MKKLLFTYILFIALNTFSQCVRIKGVLIDACSSREELNEWIVLNTDRQINIDSLRIDFDTNNNSGGTANGDINTGGICSWRTPRASSIDSLKVYSNNPNNIISVSPGGVIPANSTILVLASDSMNFAYNISNLTQYGNVYVIQNSCKRTQGAFTNLGNGANYRILKTNYNSCRDSVWHYIGNSAVNGHYGVRTRDTMRISFSNILSSSCNEFMILPIELYEFYSECLGDRTKIYFSTLSEVNTKSICIEKSLNVTDWVNLTCYESKNTTTFKEYMFYDVNDNNYYYRIKDLDYNDITSYSNIIIAKCANEQDEDYIWINYLGQIIPSPTKGINFKKFKNKVLKVVIL